MNQLVRSVTSLLFSGMLCSCSVIMAATPSKETDLSVLHKGATKTSVEKSLGKPIKYSRESHGDVAVYQYFTGDKANYNRAAAYAVLTGVTLGVAELFTSPMEALQGDRNEVHVLYTRNGRLKAYKTFFFNAPLPPPEELINK